MKPTSWGVCKIGRWLKWCDKYHGVSDLGLVPPPKLPLAAPRRSPAGFTGMGGQVGSSVQPWSLKMAPASKCLLYFHHPPPLSILLGAIKVNGFSPDSETFHCTRLPAVQGQPLSRPCHPFSGLISRYSPNKTSSYLGNSVICQHTFSSLHNH